MDGWDEDIMNITSFEKLPKNAQTYVNTVEKELKIPITWIGTGPKREAMFQKHH